VPLDRWREAFTKQDGDVKVVIDFGGLAGVENDGTDPGASR